MPALLRRSLDSTPLSARRRREGPVLKPSEVQDSLLRHSSYSIPYIPRGIGLKAEGGLLSRNRFPAYRRTALSTSDWVSV